MAEQFICDCGHPESPHSEITRGYGYDAAGKTFCYACCAADERSRMIMNGVADLYLTNGADGKGWRVSDWPGELSFPAYRVSAGWAGAFGGRIRRIDASFDGPDGFVWHARCQGDMEIARCKRTKVRTVQV